PAYELQSSVAPCCLSPFPLAPPRPPPPPPQTRPTSIRSFPRHGLPDHGLSRRPKAPPGRPAAQASSTLAPPTTHPLVWRRESAPAADVSTWGCDRRECHVWPDAGCHSLELWT